MTDLMTSDQMRQAEKSAMATGRVTGVELMERAGRGVVDAILAHWPDLRTSSFRAAVLCGPGNNGGDGYVIARHLADLGWLVEVFAFGDPSRLPPDAMVNYERWRARGAVRDIEEFAGGADVTVDALFGIGLSRPIPEVCARALRMIDGRSVAVDCPSGCDVDQGVFLLPEQEPPFYPDLCVTFHRPKLGHYLGEISATVPRVVDIGLDQTEVGEVQLVQGGKAWLDDVAFGFVTGAHKYDRGHALILGGGVGRGGAARLAARASLRAGAGLATLAVPSAALAENAARLDAVMLRVCDKPEMLENLLNDRRFSAMCLGPGLGVGEQTRELVKVALESGRLVVLDADALTSFAEDPSALFKMVQAPTVMTPHEGEFARLFPDLGERVRTVSKLEAAKRAAARSGATILLKGAVTVIASPDGRASVHAAIYDRKVPWLGTAGAGDVLAGMIAGLLAAPDARQNLHERVEVAAWLHVEAARSFGPALIAEDLADQIPVVLRSLGY